MKKEETIDYHVKACWHAIARMYNNTANQFGMTMAIGYVLLNIDHEEGTYATKIAPQVGLEVRSLTRTLKNMEADGLIRRELCDHDRRLVRIRLTEKGLRQREVAADTVKQFNYAVRERIAPEKLALLFEVMGEISQLIEEKQIFNAELST